MWDSLQKSNHSIVSIRTSIYRDKQKTLLYRVPHQSEQSQQPRPFPFVLRILLICHRTLFHRTTCKGNEDKLPTPLSLYATSGWMSSQSRSTSYILLLLLQELQSGGRGGGSYPIVDLPSPQPVRCAVRVCVSTHLFTTRCVWMLPKSSKTRPLSPPSSARGRRLQQAHTQKQSESENDPETIRLLRPPTFIHKKKRSNFFEAH